ncbi:hypothetical protein GUJ93_ZPchr0002g24369 [Zizania palustris]|uniref:Phytocyanin domain-containing protein n=1 Tax=Zizania palustris TaxID=103762 RepID=A0A8J5SLA1_ZIZPA|nr:hypothetical protein GUJ93_ZPchr0002g24369 [Zizania palustris]
MATRGRGNACNVGGGIALGAAAMLIGLLVMSAPPPAEAVTYTVGDSGGWRFYAGGWAKGRTFRAGDVLGPRYISPLCSSSSSSSHSVRVLINLCISWCICIYGAEFKYDAAVHDVTAVDLAAYRSCTVPKGFRKMRSGHDKVTLRKGMHYFICTERGHCQAGMKLAIMAV